MQQAVIENLLTESFGVRLTADEKNSLQSKAKEAGLTLSEWARQTLLRSIAFPADVRFLAEEIMATRRILVTLSGAAIQEQKLSPQEIKSLVEQVDSTRKETAETRIGAFLSR